MPIWGRRVTTIGAWRRGLNYVVSGFHIPKITPAVEILTRASDTILTRAGATIIARS